MFSEILPWLVGYAVVIAMICVPYHYRLQFVTARDRRLAEYADTMLQHFQGTVLNVQGIVNDLGAEDRVRQRVERALDDADKRLLQIREQMQQLCPEQERHRSG